MIRTVLLLPVLTWTANHACAAVPPVVVASISPVHSLAAAVMEGIGEPILLVSPGLSPHVQALRPSQARALENADLVLWIGGGLEIWLERGITSLASEAMAVVLWDAPGVLKAHGSAHHHEHHQGEEDSSDMSFSDPHIWLSTKNAIAMTTAIENALIEIDPENEARYRSNAQTQKERIQYLGSTLRARLAPFRTHTYVVFHDAYRHFSQDMELASPVAVLVKNPGRSPGAEGLLAVRTAILKSEARCVFVEPQFSPRLGETAAEDTRARVTKIDPLGTTDDPGPELYFELLEGIAQSFLDCFEPVR